MTGKRSYQPQKLMVRTIKTVAEDVDLSELKLSELTTDCHTVHRESGSCDILRASRMVDLFDYYYDLGIPVKKIEVTGGRINPRLQIIANKK